jgi:hypothetical protein
MAYFNMTNLLLSEESPDFAAICGGRRFPLHRAIVCSQSIFFERAADGDSKERFESKVDLSEEDPKFFEKFLTYLYTGNYENAPFPLKGFPSRESSLSPIGIEQELKKFTLAEHRASPEGSYMTDSLVSLRETPDEVKSLMGKLSTSLFTALRLHGMADKFGVDGLKLLARTHFYHTAP